MCILRAPAWGLLLALAAPLAAGSLRLNLTNPSTVAWQVWTSAQVRMAEEGAPAAPEGPGPLQVPAWGSLRVHLAWEDGPGSVPPLIHAEPVEGATALVWTLAPDRLHGWSHAWNLHFTPFGPHLLPAPAEAPPLAPQVPAAPPVLLPVPAAAVEGVPALIPPQEPDPATDADEASEASGSRDGAHPAPLPSRSSRSSRVRPKTQTYATLSFETRGGPRRITALDATRLPRIAVRAILPDGSLAAKYGYTAWVKQGRRHSLYLVPGIRYSIRLTENHFFAHDPTLTYSRVLLLSGPGGEPWNAAALVGSRVEDGPDGEPWQFRLRKADTLPGFVEEERNQFVFGPVAAGAPHGVTFLPLDLSPDGGGPAKPSRKRPRVPAATDAQTLAKKPRDPAIHTRLTVHNHLDQPCHLRADQFRRGRSADRLDLEGRPLGGSIPWKRLDGQPEDTAHLKLPPGKAVRLSLGYLDRFSTGQRQRQLHLEIPGGTAGATLVAVQQSFRREGREAPWKWFLRDAAGREVTALPGIELSGETVRIRPLGEGDATQAVPRESKDVAAWESVEEEAVDSGTVPLAGPAAATEPDPGLLDLALAAEV